ncbi:hypothetical protein [Rhodothermus profundi]|uniref:Uncharacterized protein n=1 Tax=Rhodothermus profundi TaxID=633813 RepID=A0A1M6TTU8_9BACT|nr:hypothetical protein [Rhodothermus profundi]SHK60377.1 hypothetical protein SAMN04488087_1534 [Rhodothermus profundi]
MARSRDSRQATTRRLVDELIAAARQLGLEVRLETGPFRGGHCIKQGDELIMLNRRHPPEVHLALLAEALRTRPLDTLYLKPAVRRALEEAWARSSSSTDAAVLDVAFD